MTCKLFLRFRRDTDESKVDKNYFSVTAANTPIPSLDANGDGAVSEAEWNAAAARGSEIAPLTNSNENPAQPIWFSVNDHLVRIKIEGASIPGDTMTAPALPWAPRIVAFSDAAGNAIQDNVQRDGNHVAVPAGTNPPQELTVKSINGVITLHLRSGVLIHRATRIDLSADDITQKP